MLKKALACVKTACVVMVKNDARHRDVMSQQTTRHLMIVRQTDRRPGSPSYN